MARLGPGIWVAVSIFVAIVTLWSSFPAIATISNSATLAAGETTADGKLTLVVIALASGSSSVALRNNSLFTVVVDQYSLSPGDSYRCRGRNLTISSHVTRTICLATNVRMEMSQHATPSPMPYRSGAPSPTPIPFTPEPVFGRASLQLALTWHQSRRPTPTESPTPTATPSPQTPSS